MPPPSETVIQPTIEVAPGITIPIGPPTTVPARATAGGVPGRPAGSGCARCPGAAASSAPVSPFGSSDGSDEGRPASPSGLPCRRPAAGGGSAAAPTIATCPAAPMRSARRSRSDRRAGGPARADRPGAVPDSAAGDADSSPWSFLALGYSTKAACLQTNGSGTADQRVGNWANQRAYYELCYSDTVPLYTAELLNLGKFPYKSSWIENDSEGKPRIQYDGNTAVRYMEYPVLTGVYQYLSMALAEDLHGAEQAGVGADHRRGGDVLQYRRVRSGAGVAGDGVGDVLLAGPRRIWDAALVAASPLVIFQIFTNFDALATAFATGAPCWPGRGEDRCWPAR